MLIKQTLTISFFILFSKGVFAQLDNTYYFNGKQDSTFYREYPNAFYAEKGFPVNFDGTFIIERTNKHKTYLVQMLDTVTRLEAEMILFDYLISPETGAKEKVIIDKFPVKLKGSPRKAVYLGNVISGEKLDVKDLNFQVKLPDEDLESNATITQIDLAYGTITNTVKGTKLTEAVKKHITDLPEGTLIHFDIHYTDLRGKPGVLKADFVR